MEALLVSIVVAAPLRAVRFIAATLFALLAVVALVAP